MTTSRGDTRMLVVDGNPTERMFHAPEGNRFVIPPLNELPAAPDSIARAAREGHYNWRLLAFMLSSLIPVAFLVFWRRAPTAAQAHARISSATLSTTTGVSK